ncbi:MAG: helix-turn-helix domain-containing protein [Bacteroidota bacterium]
MIFEKLQMPMHYRRFKPANELSHLVRYYWSFDARQHSVAQLIIQSFADRFPRLIFQDVDQFSSICNAHGKAMPVCYLSGIDTAPTTAVMAGAFSHFGVSFFPHALPVFFRIGATELANTMPDVECVTRDGLTELLRHQPHEQRVRLLNRYLLEKLKWSTSVDHLVHRLINDAQVHARSVNSLPAIYQVSERQLQRRFKQQVGVSLKKYQRVVRFEQTLTRLSGASYCDLTAIAADMDYTDQSHFIKEFNEFAGITPYAFVSRKNVGAESSSFLYLPD